MNELFLKRMHDLLKDDYFVFLKSYDEKVRKSFQLNTLKTDGDILKNIDGIEKMNIKDGYYYDMESLGNHPYHHAGLFYIQEPSAMLPPLAIDIKDDFKILDLCAAPGGKTHILSKQVPNGYVIANEVNYKRAKKLLSNVERLGLKNVLVSSMSVDDLLVKYRNYFDVVLVDAPCSGEGMFRKDKEALKNWSLDKVKELSILQKDLLKKASLLVNSNGHLIYSTCTFSKEENEEVIKSFIDNYDFSLVDVKREVKMLSTNGFIDKVRRCYPFIFGEGQFIAVLKNNQNVKPYIACNVLKNLSKKEEQEYNVLLSKYLKNKPFILKKYKNNIVALEKNIEIPDLSLLCCGVKVGDYSYNKFVIHHQFVKAYGHLFYNTYNLNVNDKEVIRYLKGEEIKGIVKDGYGVLLVDNYPLGLYKASQNRLKNYYPKGLRIKDS